MQNQTVGANMAKKMNFLILVGDQINGTLFPDGPAEWLHTPNLKQIFTDSTRFQNTYTASPLCVPSRASFMSGQLPSRNHVYDNAAEFVASIPTYAHHLRKADYYTCLAGKMHFVGPDQLHGFEDRLTTDIYPADFGWTPDYRKPGERIEWWYHNMSSVTSAGIAEISNQLEFDDDVAHFSAQKIYDLGRRKDDRPWCLTVSFTHPHDPYLTRKKYWDLYADCAHLLPTVSALDYEQLDAHSKRIYDANDTKNYNITKENIRDARRAYFANISYIDDKIGEIMTALKATDQEEDTIVIFTSDHGDMLGEKGLWYKMNFFEGSARVPLLIRAPQLKSGLITQPISNMDLVPTIAELAGIDISEILPWTDGSSLVPLANYSSYVHPPTLMEYAAEASYAPLVAIVENGFKFIYCELDPPMLFDLNNDPGELTNLYSNPDYHDIQQKLEKQCQSKWDLAKFDAEVRQSQASRWVVYDALRKGRYHSWDYQTQIDASRRYMRNHMDLNDVEDNQRYPKG